MIKVGDKVRILANKKVDTVMLHHFLVGDIVEVIRVFDQNDIMATGKYEGGLNTTMQLLINTSNMKCFEKV